MPDMYVLASRAHILRHYQAQTTWFGDYAEPRNPELDAAARSGDYFITLATELENIAAELPETSTAASSIALSRLAQKLEYMQRHYQIVRKHAADPHQERATN